MLVLGLVPKGLALTLTVMRTSCHANTTQTTALFLFGDEI